MEEASDRGKRTKKEQRPSSSSFMYLAELEVIIDSALRSFAELMQSQIS
jgi:hypothetical protein